MALATAAAPSREDFAALLEDSFAHGNLQEGAVIKGTVVAIENGWELDWQNPAVLRPFVEHGERIEVTGARAYKISVSAQNASRSSSGNSQAENWLIDKSCTK